jgi:hypothetical protein
MNLTGLRPHAGQATFSGSVGLTSFLDWGWDDDTIDRPRAEELIAALVSPSHQPVASRIHNAAPITFSGCSAAPRPASVRPTVVRVDTNSVAGQSGGSFRYPLGGQIARGVRHLFDPARARFGTDWTRVSACRGGRCPVCHERSAAAVRCPSSWRVELVQVEVGGKGKVGERCHRRCTAANTSSHDMRELHVTQYSPPSTG